MHQETPEQSTPLSETAPTSTIAVFPVVSKSSHDAYRALRFRDFRLLLAGVFLVFFSQQMMTVALGWELYARTRSALVLGGIGLAQVIPVIVLFLPAGYVADRYSRKHIVLMGLIVLVLASLGLATLSYLRAPLLLIYVCLVVIGGAQSFYNPASSALVSQVVPEQAFENATTWRSSVGQLSAVLGPASGGFLIGLFHGATLVYVLGASLFLIFALLVLFIRARPQQTQVGSARKLSSLLDGLRFLGQTQVMLAAITLDLFAVLLGGATTLLPIFAQDILHVGPIGLGWLQAASSLGAVCMALTLAQRPPFKRAGRALLLAVSGFGVATIIFGLSHWFWLSFLMLILLGAFDNISVVIRSTLLLVRTPDAMRGRVSAVSSLFIGTSNQLGGFESGLAAQLFGPVPAVVLGGIGTLLVVTLVAMCWPEMRRLGTLREGAVEY
ncbi:MAG TPA: MFS transporter [Ktedonobacteraceae bacterium]|nr:MFS transporter [Ktedonobacteraceae bacterium]